jgi:hypothetical protein
VANERKASKQNIDAKAFQKPLAELGNTIALKAEREGVKLIEPRYVAIDIYVMIRQGSQNLRPVLLSQCG